LPQRLKPAAYADGRGAVTIPPATRRPPADRQLVGVDVFVQSTQTAEALAAALRATENEICELTMITNRGIKVWPGGLPETFCTDHWRCRFMAKSSKRFNRAMVVELLRRLNWEGIDFIKTEQLYTFDGAPGYSLGQGQ